MDLSLHLLGQHLIDKTLGLETTQPGESIGDDDGLEMPAS